MTPGLIKVLQKFRALASCILMACFFACSLEVKQSSEDDRSYETEEAIYRQGADQRLQQLLGSKTFPIGRGDSDPDAGKRDWPRLLSEMYKVRRDTARLMSFIQNEGRTLVFSEWAGNFCKPFTMPGLTMYYFTFKQLLPEDQKQEIYETLYTKKKDCIKDNKIGWDYLMREDHYMDPIYGETEFNSENFNWMSRMAGYLFAHEFNDSLRIAYFDTYVKNWIRTLYHVGRLEWNSNNYWGHTFNPLLVLYQHAPDKEVKEMAKAGLDWMVLEAALHYLDGFQAAGDVRAKSGAYKPFAGSVWGYSYIFFAKEGHLPSYLKPGFSFGNKDLKDFTGYLPYIDYYPPQAVIDIANRNYELPVEIRSAKPFYLVDNNNYGFWKGDHENSRRFEFETIYQDENLLMSSLASNRPDGNFKHNALGEHQQMPFSEEGLWRLAVKGDSTGAHQLFGNSGAQQTLAGRSPFEEIVQFRNIMIRMVKGTDNSWLAVPKNFKPEMEEDILFFDLGSGVYVAILPVNALEFEKLTYEDPTHTVYKWKFNTKELGGTILECGVEKQYGSFLLFKEKIMASPRYKLSSPNTIEYENSNGDRLKAIFKDPVTYTAFTGEVIYPAGTTALAWGNERLLNYDQWQVYETVFGSEIVQQRWGNGTLQLKSKDHKLRISVDPRSVGISRAND